MIEWKEGAVCYAGGAQRRFGAGVVYWLRSDDKWIAGSHIKDSEMMIECNDFQINEPKSGYYIPKSELDTEEKYNQAVEVFGLFGDFFAATNIASTYQVISDDECIVINPNSILRFDSVNGVRAKTKLTFDQLMAIGELKRKMNEREWKGAVSKVLSDSVNIFAGITDNHIYGGNTSELPNSSKPAKNIKAKEAYRILESMGIEWDNVEGKWFKVVKEWL